MPQDTRREQCWDFWRGRKANSAERKSSWHNFQCPGAAREALADLLLSSLALCALKPPPSPCSVGFFNRKRHQTLGRYQAATIPECGQHQWAEFFWKAGLLLLQALCARKQGSQANICSPTPFLLFAAQRGLCGLGFSVFWEPAFPTGTLQQHPKAERL